ncbi:MAG: tetratricopeptide repeat protein [Deltaproteobacteria bacterium]|nr:tetratricopeptide repeat protein [Deltaproteobacteria bacterium]
MLRACIIAFAAVLTLAAASAAWAGESDLERLLAEQIRSGFESGRIEPAGRDLDEFTRKFPDSLETPKLKLLQAQRQTDLFAAMPLYRALVESRPDSPEAATARLDLAGLYLNTGNAMAALKEVDALIAAKPSPADSAKARWIAARANASLGRHAAAAEHYAALIALYPDSEQIPAAMLGLAEARLQLGQAPEARSMFSRLLEKHAAAIDAPRAGFGLAQAMERAGDRRGAIGVYRRIVEQAPASPYAASARERLTDLDANPDARASRSMRLTREQFTVRLGVFPNAEAERTAAQFVQQGFKTIVRPVDDTRTEVLVGEFGTQLQANFFAEELANKFGRALEVVPLVEGTP